MPCTPKSGSRRTKKAADRQPLTRICCYNTCEMDPRFLCCAMRKAIPALILVMFLGAPGARAAEAPANASVVELRIDGEIEPVMAEYVIAGIDRAAESHAQLVLITINTPGGLDSSMRSMIQKILASPVPVVTYVAPSGSRAASAGFFILLSADVAAMAPGTDTGAASPLLEVGGAPVQVDETLRKKILNEATAYLRSYVAQRGRNTDLASTAVTDAKAFSEKEALDGKLIDLAAASTDALLAQLNGRSITRFDGTRTVLDLAQSRVENFEMTPRQRFLSRLVQPDLFFILLIIGVLGMYAEFTHPGLFAPGVIGGIALVLALYAMHLLPVSLTGLVLLALAVGLFVLEAKFPTHGILGVGGAAAMILGALMLIRSPLTGWGVSLVTALGVTLPFALIVIFLMRLVLESRSWKQTTGLEQLVGEIGEVIQPLGSDRVAGMVRIHGELWQAVGPQGIPLGAQVRVRKVDGLTLQVEPVEVRA
jgi:membrane-bound serine protease (ClpP class)